MPSRAKLSRLLAEALPRSGSRSFGRHAGELMFNGRSSRGLYPPSDRPVCAALVEAQPTRGTNHLWSQGRL